MVDLHHEKPRWILSKKTRKQKIFHKSQTSLGIVRDTRAVSSSLCRDSIDVTKVVGSQSLDHNPHEAVYRCWRRILKRT